MDESASGMREVYLACALLMPVVWIMTHKKIAAALVAIAICLQ